MTVIATILGALRAIGSALSSYFRLAEVRELKSAGRAEAERDAALAGLEAKGKLDEKQREVAGLSIDDIDDRLRPWFRNDR